jgi:chromatin remodeling complex protein RSC6
MSNRRGMAACGYRPFLPTPTYPHPPPPTPSPPSFPWHRLSPEMAAFMGSPSASRPEVTKAFWAYVRQHDLQDPANKQFIISDNMLHSLTGQERFQAFSFSKFTKQHMLAD